MFLARQLKKENICEYLLYMWQTEDLLRAFDLNIDFINEKIIKIYPDTDEKHKKELSDWYESLLDMMRREERQKNGHLQININTLSQIEEFHFQMLHSGKNTNYNAVFYRITLHLQELRKKSNTLVSDIELCFNFLYGILMLKLKKEKISAETMNIQTEISNFLKLLAVNFKQFQNGELTFEE